MERKCNGGVQVIERQTAELAFRFDGTERNGNITVFMPPTVCTCMTNMCVHVHPFMVVIERITLMWCVYGL